MEQHQQQQQYQQQLPPPLHVSHPQVNLPPAQSHPSYPDMIAAAIVWNNGQGKESGSSKRAIAKYIERAYTNLPPGHEALLVHNLKRMKAMGQLVMLKNSYQLPSLIRSTTPIINNNNNNHIINNNNNNPPPPPPTNTNINPPPPPTPSLTPSSLSPKRRGRPPKAKPINPIPTQPSPIVHLQPQPLPQQAQPQPQQTNYVASGGATAALTGSTPKRRGRPRKIKEDTFVVTQAEPISQYQPPSAFQVQLENNSNNGSVEVPVQQETVQKRRPGRPPKKPKVDVPVQVQVQAPQQVHAAPAVQQPQPQPQTVSYSVTANGVAVAENLVVQKRRPGRPARSGVVQRKVYYKPNGRPRGRPRKNAVVGGVVGGQGLGGGGGGMGVKRRPGRPPKLGVGVAMGMKRRGRPPKGIVGGGVSVGVGMGMAGGVVKAKGTRGWPKGKPRGPMKDSPIVRIVRIPPSDRGMAYEELTSKLELIQLKIRDVVGIIRPHVASDNAALSALLQLEELANATANVSGPPISTSTAPVPTPSPPSPMHATITDPPTQSVPVSTSAAPTLSVPVSTSAAPTLSAPPGAPVIAPPFTSAPAPFASAPTPFTISMAPSMTVPFYAPSSENQHQPMSWFPPSAQS